MGEIAGAFGRHETRGEPPNLGLGRGQFGGDGVEPRHHPLHVAVDRRGRRVKRDRRDRRRRVGADAGQRGERRLALWKVSAMALDYGLGAGVQMPRARVIAEPGPELEHVLERRRRERAHARPARGKAREIGYDRLGRGLLQHDLGEPDAIGVGPFTGQRAPGKLAAMAVVPGQEIGAEISADRARRLRRALSPLHPNC